MTPPRPLSRSSPAKSDTGGDRKTRADEVAGKLHLVEGVRETPSGETWGNLRKGKRDEEEAEGVVDSPLCLGAPQHCSRWGIP
eukprot:CAMPEP_0175470796 /NCGR_PEP_ID=MMETSP0095-20121207/73030_1 /TAXON_ID=311494 /ORGANISM="Alexandrium monilatum, Strain CCMP3105" /LENGTH=82 /DNA_ID=CAMNT_0016772231 /DNA_START=41 /DNA_END=287 /DNA_ORIENTATION=+